MKSHAARLAGTAEVPYIADGIAAAPDEEAFNIDHEFMRDFLARRQVIEGVLRGVPVFGG
jgi:hypothetical protein